MTDPVEQKATRRHWCAHQWTWPFRTLNSKHGQHIKQCTRCGKVEGAWS